MFGEKLFNIGTPYKRVFINFKCADDKVFTLPGKNTALFVVGKGDLIHFEEIGNLEKMAILDKSTIEDKTCNFTDDYNGLKDFIKNQIFHYNSVSFEIENKIVIGELLAVNCILINPKEK